jgi:hypothetical protein
LAHQNKDVIFRYKENKDMSKRGRIAATKEEDQPTKFVRTIVHTDGTIAKWHYDLDKTKNGPIMVEFDDKNSVPIADIIVKEKKAKADKKQYLNPATGRYVAEFRAKQLGLIK